MVVENDDGVGVAFEQGLVFLLFGFELARLRQHAAADQHRNQDRQQGCADAQHQHQVAGGLVGGEGFAERRFVGLALQAGHVVERLHQLVLQGNGLLLQLLEGGVIVFVEGRLDHVEHDRLVEGREDVEFIHQQLLVRRAEHGAQLAAVLGVAFAVFLEQHEERVLLPGIVGDHDVVHQHLPVANGVAHPRGQPGLDVVDRNHIGQFGVQMLHLGDPQPDHRQHQQQGGGEAKPHIEHQAAQRRGQHGGGYSRRNATTWSTASLMPIFSPMAWL